MVAPLFSDRGTKPISGMEILPLGRKSLHHSVNLMPSSLYSLKAGWSHFRCFPEAVCFLPTRRTALTTATSEAHLNLAQRSRQKDTNQTVSKRAKDECTSFLPNLCTGGIFVGCNKAAVSHCLVSGI